MVDKLKWGVHETHCCVLHGCKYGEEDCPVVLKQTKQRYTCESCGYEGIKTLEDLHTIADTDINKDISDLFNMIENWEGHCCNLIQEENYKALKRRIIDFSRMAKRATSIYV